MKVILTELHDLPFTSTMLDVRAAGEGLLKEDTQYCAWLAINEALEK